MYERCTVATDMYTIFIYLITAEVKSITIIMYESFEVGHGDATLQHEFEMQERRLLI